MSNNQKLSKIFHNIGDFLAIEGAGFKSRAYHRVARGLKELESDVAEIYKNGGQKAIEQIPNIGEGIAKKIVEFLKTGKIEYYEKIKSAAPFDIELLSRVQGLGPKRARKLYEELEIRNLDDLQKAAKEGRITPLAGFGEKMEKNILQAVGLLRTSKGRFPLKKAILIAEKIEQELVSQENVKMAVIAGSIRRKRPTIGDIDILVVVSPGRGKKSGAVERVMEFFTGMPTVAKVWSIGPSRSSVRLRQGLDADLRIIAPGSFGAALQYFTGSKDHNIALRALAKSKGLKLNEYGLFRGEKKIAGRTEEGIYKALGVDFLPPESRETGKIKKRLLSA